MTEDVVEHDELAVDFEGALGATVLRIPLPHDLIKLLSMELIQKPARATLDFANVPGAFRLRQETFRRGTKAPLYRAIELAAKEVTGMKGNHIEEGCLPLRIPQVAQRVDRIVLHGTYRHRSSTQSSV